MITAFLKLNHSPTTITSLPPSLLSRFQKSIRLLILRTILHAMPFPVTQIANFRLTSPAFAIFSPILLMYILRLDPFSTPPCRTIYTTFGRKFVIFAIPSPFEIIVE